VRIWTRGFDIIGTYPDIQRKTEKQTKRNIRDRKKRKERKLGENNMVKRTFEWHEQKPTWKGKELEVLNFKA
jgi:hypothetical protein